MKPKLHFLPSPWGFINWVMDHDLGKVKKKKKREEKLFGHSLEGLVNLFLGSCANSVLWV